MTLPEGAAGEQLALIYQHADEVAALEDAAAAAATASLRSRLQGVSAWLASTWVRRFGSLDAVADPSGLHEVLNELRLRLRGVSGVDASSVVLLYGDRALTMGVKQAGSEIGVSLPIEASLTDATSAAAAAIPGNLAGRLGRAEKLLSVIRDSKHDDVVPALAAAHTAINDVDRAARWVVNREVNNGIGQLASVLFADTMWVAERDGCVVCLAYSGVVAPYGRDFPPDLTFGDPGKLPAIWPHGPLDAPPRHVHCRCRVTPWIGHDTDGARLASIPGWHKGQASANQSLSDALKREARRSILDGWSLASEPESVRLDAADRLLKRGANMPKSVEARARKAVKAGRFGPDPSVV